jgi:hypothetical protein
MRNGRLTLLLASILLPVSTAQSPLLQTIDLQAVEGTLKSIADGQVVMETSAGQETIPIGDVSEIVFSPQAYNPQANPMTRLGKAAVVLANGDVLSATKGQLEGGAFAGDNPMLGRPSVAIEKVSAIYIAGPAQRPMDIVETCKEMEIDHGTADRMLLVAAEGAYLPVEGALKAIGRKSDDENAETIVTFNWSGQDRETLVRNVRAILLADVRQQQPEGKTIGCIVGTDGTTVSFTSLTFSEEQLVAETPSFGTITLNMENTAAIRFKSDRVVNLTDLEPSSVVSYGMVTDSVPYKRNRSVTNNPLSLDGVVYSTGLGLHSFTELTYELDGQFNSFVTVVGIDDAVRPNGDAALTFLGDYKQLTEPLRLTGQSDPQVVRLDIHGVKQLTIRLDFGDDGLGVSDHIDLAGARLIK